MTGTNPVINNPATVKLNATVINTVNSNEAPRNIIPASNPTNSAMPIMKGDPNVINMSHTITSPLTHGLLPT